MTGLLAHVDLVSPDGEKLSVHDGAGWGQGETAGQEGDWGQEDTWGEVLLAFV